MKKLFDLIGLRMVLCVDEEERTTIVFAGEGLERWEQYGSIVFVVGVESGSSLG